MLIKLKLEQTVIKVRKINRLIIHAILEYINNVSTFYQNIDRIYRIKIK
jgi:hypothetical protein